MDADEPETCACPPPYASGRPLFDAALAPPCDTWQADGWFCAACQALLPLVRAGITEDMAC